MAEYEDFRRAFIEALRTEAKEADNRAALGDARNRGAAKGLRDTAKRLEADADPSFRAIAEEHRFDLAEARTLAKTMRLLWGRDGEDDADGP